MTNPDFEGYRQIAKRQYEDDENIPNFLSEDLHQMPDNTSTFMTRIRRRHLAKIAAMMRDAKYLTQESPGMQVLTVLKSSGTMWKVIMDRVVLAIYLIQNFKQHTWKEDQTVL
jgi:hypothetical protein